MILTDDYLKQLKDRLLTDEENIILSIEQGYALLARLEAAEKVCERYHYFLRHNIIDPEYNSEEYEAWLKSAGKNL